MKELKLVQSRDEIKKDPAKVGQAVYDILSKPQEMQTVEETYTEMTPKYFEELKKACEDNASKFSPPFYIVVLRKKEFWADNVLRQWFVARQTRPDPRVLRRDYPNHDHDLWKYNHTTGDVSLQWTLPTKQDADMMLRNWQLYHSDLIRWISEFNAGTLA
jgi:hypothetical protein